MLPLAGVSKNQNPQECLLSFTATGVLPVITGK